MEENAKHARRDNITLIGMPGAGKSTLGVALARKLGYRFVDTDLLIQEGAGLLLHEIIERRGVEGFLAYENQIISGLDCEHHIIATGGSAVYGKAGMENLRRLGRIVFIDIGTSDLHKRLKTKDDMLERGVIIRKGNTIEDLLAERLPLYRAYADIAVNTSGLSPRESINLLALSLQQ